MSSSQAAVSAYVESSSSAMRMESSSSSYQAGNVAAIETKSNSATKKIEGSSGGGKPTFVKTLEGSNVERKYLGLDINIRRK